MKRVRVKERKRLVKGGVPVPVEDPGIDVRIARIGDRAAEVRRKRPRHCDAQRDEQQRGGRVLPRHAGGMLS
jgi:hypothetical protein